MSLRKPVASLAILLLLASSLLVVAPVGATHGGTPKVQILSPDYETAPVCTPTPTGVTGPCIQGLGAFFAIEVQDTDLTAATTTLTARVTSTIDLVGETITLTRHKPSSGAGEDTFFGTVGFESSIVAANGRVRVVDGDNIVVTYTAPSGIPSTATLRFFESVSGTISLDALTYYGADFTNSSSKARVTVTDADLNADPNSVESRTGLVTVRTSANLSAVVGVALTETGINTGIFTGEFFFANNTSVNDATGGASRIQVSGGFGPEGPITTTLTVRYNDTVDVLGNVANVTTTAAWQEARTSVLDFVSADFRTVMTGRPYEGTDKAYLRVFDLDKDSTSATDTVTVSLTSGIQPAPAVIITLTESGPHTGEFFGSIDLVSSVIAGKLRVSDSNPAFGTNETLTATYDDAFNTTGGDPAAPSNTAGAFWIRRTDGTVRLTRSDFNTDTSDFYGAGTANSLLGRMFIRVDDIDRNNATGFVDNITVLVSSTMDPANNVTVALVETSETSNIFAGSANFTEGVNVKPTVAGQLWVNDRSTVTVTYDDINGVGTQIARTDSAVWHAEETGAIATDVRDDKTIRGIRAASLGTTITVVDAGANINRAVAETITVTVATPNVTSSASILLTLTETHANSGVFRGMVGFSNTTSSSTSSNPLVRVNGTGAFATDVVITYEDAFNDAGTPVTTTQNFTWDRGVSSVDTLRFSSLVYYFGDVATIVLVGNGTLENVTAANTVQRCVTSSVDGTGYNLTFTQTAQYTGVYTASLRLLTTSTNATTPPSINVNEGSNSTVSVATNTCTAPSTGNTTVHTAPLAAPAGVQFTMKNLSTLAPNDHKDFGINRSAFLTVLDLDQNQDSDLRETIVVTAGDETLTLLETGTNSSEFRRAVLYENTPAANNGAIGVASGATVTLSFTDTRHPSGSTVFTDTVTWYKAGSVVFQDTLGGTTATGYFGARNLFLEVTDPFQSKAAGVGDVNTADHLFVTVQSRDSADSLLVDLTETGADTGVFRGSVELVPFGGTNSATVLLVGSAALDRDDLINVTFQDNNTASPGGEQIVEHVLATIAWTRAETGVLCLTKPPVLGNVFTGGVTDCSATQPAVPASTFPDLDRYHGLAGHQRQSYVFLNDTGLDTTTGADSADIRIFSTSDATGINVVARETAARSGLFLASFGFTTGGSSDTSDSLKVAEGDAISATYNDPKRTDGTTAAVLVANTVLWNQTFTGSIGVDKQKFSGTDSPIVTLTDLDLDTSSAADTFVLAYQFTNLTTAFTATSSWSTVTVTETGSHTGIFRATGVSFSTGGCAALNPHICVNATGSNIRFVYNETRNIDGRAPEFPAVDVTWRPVNSGYVLLDLELYATFAATGTITVVDSGMNADTIAVNTGFVRLLSNSDPTGEIITVTETGLNTGIFTGPAAFESARTVGNGKVLVSDGDLVTALYYDEIDGTPVPDDAVDNDTARFQSSAPVAPTAIIAAAPLSGAPPLAVTFTLSASDDGQITGWGLDVNNDGTNEFTGSDNLKAGSVQKSHSYSNAGTFTAKLTVTDNNGITGSSTVTITVSAAVVPGAPVPTLTSNVTTGPAPLFVNFTLGASDDGTIASWRFDADGNGVNDFTGVEDIEATPLNRLFNFATPGTYTATLNVTDNVGTQANVTRTIIVTNGTPPTPTLTTPTQTGVAPLQVNFTLAATDDGTIASWTFDANGDGTNEFTGTDNLKAASLIRSHNYTVAGTFVAKLTVTDNQANSVNTTVTITVAAPTTPSAVTAASIQAANQGIVVTVTRDGDDNIVSWTLPSNLPATPKGVQIWRALSPFTLLKTLLVTDADYQDRSFRDEDAPATAKYIVTVFYGFTPDQGFFAGPGDPEGQIPGFAALGSGTAPAEAGTPGSDGSGLSTLAWVLIILGIVVVLALIVLLVIMLTRKKDEEVVEEGQAGWSEPAVETAPVAPVVAGDVHTLRCPACSTEFQATGPKPLTTNCPNCGRRGILR